MKTKKVLIGISGGIAVYKVCTLVNLFLKRGDEVKVLMTDSATKFVSPLTFQSLTKSPVYTSVFDVYDSKKIEHIFLADWADVFIIVPATANVIGKIASGIADDILTTVAMALPTKTPVVFSPAMNVHMWENIILQRNITSLEKIKIGRSQKYNFVPPREGILACEYEGKGKVADLEEVIKVVDKILI